MCPSPTDRSTYPYIREKHTPLPRPSHDAKLNRRREDEIGMDTAEQSNEHSSHMAVSPLVQERRNVLAPIDSTASPARSTTQGKCVSPREELEKTVAPILQKNHVEWVSPMHGGEVGSTRSTESSPQMLHGRGDVTWQRRVCGSTETGNTE